MESRVASCTRVTKETQIEMTLNLDGTGKTDISTGIGFFDHMLSGFARHGLFDLTVKVTGDLEVDSHHTIEDTGIVLGQTIAKALGDKKGIKRYGHFMLPMDEVLVLSAIDLSGRPYDGCCRHPGLSGAGSLHRCRKQHRKILLPSPCPVLLICHR